MQKVRNGLLILLALVVGLAVIHGVANANICVDYNNPWTTPTTTGEPDTPSTKAPTVKTSASQVRGEEGAPQVSRALWFEWASRIWAAMYLGVGR